MSAGLVQKIGRHSRSIGLGLVFGALVLAALGMVAWYQAGGPAGFRGLPSSYEGTKLDKLEGAAPGFRLVDQNGASVSLADFRGMVVVLTLLDPDCTDICPIYAYHYRLAYQALGQDAAKVAFLAFNANDEKTSVEDVMAATRKWSVDEIPTWHFLTGSPEALRAVWKAYGMVASSLAKPGKPNEKAHSPANFVIDQTGRRRWYLSTNFEGAPPLSALIVKHVKALLAEERRQTLAYVEQAKVSALARLGEGAVNQAGPVASRYRKPWHEMDLVLDKGGAWDVQLVIDGPRAQGKVSFQVDVSN